MQKSRMNRRDILKGSAALYDRIGDLNAFSLVQQHFEALHAVTVRHRGAIVKSIGDGSFGVVFKAMDFNN